VDWTHNTIAENRCSAAWGWHRSRRT